MTDLKKIEILDHLASCFSLDEILEYLFRLLDQYGNFRGKLIYFIEEENQNYLRTYKSEFDETFKEMEKITFKALIPIHYYEKIKECLWNRSIVEIRKDQIDSYDEMTQSRIRLWKMQHTVYFPIYKDNKDIIGMLILMQSDEYIEKEKNEQIHELIQLFYYHLKYSLKISKIISNQKEVDIVKQKYTKLMNLAKQINVLVEPEKLYLTIVTELLKIFDFQIGFVMLEKDNYLLIEYGLGVDEESNKIFTRVKDYLGKKENAYQIMPLVSDNGGACCLAFTNRSHFYFYDINSLKKMPMTEKDKIGLNIAGETLKTVIQIPIYNNEKTYGILQLWSTSSNRILTEGDIEMMTNICSYIPSILKNSELHALLGIQKKEVEQKNKQIQINNKAMIDELRLARQIQQSIIPKEIPKIPGIETAVLYKPMDQIGGDFYDFKKIDPGNHLGIFVSDVSGHGVPAALITTMLKSIVETADSQKNQPAGLLEYVNENICGQINGNLIMAFYGIFDPNSGEFKYARGSDNYPVLIRAGKLTELKSKGKILGVTPNLYFEEKILQLKKKDKIIIYTDGLTKTMNSEKKDFSDKFNQLLVDFHDKPIQVLIDTIYIELIKHSENYHFDDDICVVGFELV